MVEGGSHLLRVGQQVRGGLVRDEHPHLLGMLGHQHESGDRTAAASEDVHRPHVERRDQPVHVISVLLGRRLLGGVGPLAAPDAARVVGHHRPVPEMSGQSGEAGRVHGQCDHQ